jgi:actin-like ATPase involved in cell morphogenesis
MDYRLGVDLGTTYTAAAILRGDEPEMVSLGDRELFAPSVLVLNPDGSVLVGDPAEQRAPTASGRTIREFKARIGDTTPVLLGGVPYTAESLMATLLRWVIDLVSQREGAPPAAVAVTYPAGWAQHRRDKLAEVLLEAGVEQPVFVTEPEAAAVRYASTERVSTGDIVGVYDLGGGTFDAAVLRRGRYGFELLGRPDGLDDFGGAAIDSWVFEHVREAVGDEAFDLDPADPAAALALHRLRRECVLAKEALSHEAETTIPVILPGTNTVVRLTRAELEDAVRPELQQTVTTFRRTLTSAGITPEDLSAIVVAGGVSRMPLVRELLAAELGRPLAGDLHPKYVVALGAAMRALPAPLPDAGPDPADDPGPFPPGVGEGQVVPRPGGVPEAGEPLPTVTVESVRSARPPGDLGDLPAAFAPRRPGGPRRASAGRAAGAGTAHGLRTGPAVAAAVLGVVVLLLAFVGLGGPDDGEVTVANPAGGEVRLADPVRVTQDGRSVGEAVLTPTVAGVDLGRQTVTADGALSLRGLRYVLAGPFEATVERTSDGLATGDLRAAVVRPAGGLGGGGLLSIPGVIGVALLLFAVAYAESFLRPLRKGRPASNGTLLGMGLVGFAAGAGLALVGWVLGGHLLTMPLLLLTAIAGLAAALLLTTALTPPRA